MGTNYTHLTQGERKHIEKMLTEGKSVKEISVSLERSTGTISREITRNASVRQTGGFGTPFNNCQNRKSCMQFRLCKKEDCIRQVCRGCRFCFRLCPDFIRESCGKLKQPPYVCNGCPLRQRCPLEKFIYEAKSAHRSYRTVLSDSRSGIAVSGDELERIDRIVSPLLKRGQSVYAVCRNHKDEIMLDEATLYAYVKEGLLSAKPLDFPRMVKFRPRRKKKSVKVEAGCRKGRSYRDFLKYAEEFAPPVVQMDSVAGKHGDGEKVLLTLHITECELMLIFPRAANTAKSVVQIFNDLYMLLGHEEFVRLFPVILTDNGSEFSQPSAIEFTKDGVRRTRVFYCDPGAAWQKGSIENNHSLIRRIIPKSTSFNNFSDDDFVQTMNHINSYPRKKLNGKSAFQAFSFLHNPLLLEVMGLSTIHHDEVTLLPELLKK
jgi:IS30 family transposase